MRTESKNISAVDARFAALARMGEVIFWASDAATIWGIANQNTLHVTLSRMVRGGLLWRLHNGLYSLKDPATLSVYLIGSKALHRFCYIGGETILAGAGIIQQHVSATTLVSSVSRRFSLAGHRYVCRQLADAYLMNDAGLVRDEGVLVATPERAIADMLYFNPRYHFDAHAHIDWTAVRTLQETIGYPISASL